MKIRFCSSLPKRQAIYPVVDSKNRRYDLILCAPCTRRISTLWWYGSKAKPGGAQFLQRPASITFARFGSSVPVLILNIILLSGTRSYKCAEIVYGLCSRCRVAHSTYLYVLHKTEWSVVEPCAPCLAQAVKKRSRNYSHVAYPAKEARSRVRVSNNDVEFIQKNIYS